ncbi:uncharacterized protein JCM6883_007558 [Sporobolomyces salmoneus]|uniref:uncharacterized protein n=1 Tax=Sporobolomyces salmoneus TaxID=183962 RepID=UPI00316F6270
MGNNGSTPSSSTSHPHLSASRGGGGSSSTAAQLRSSPRPRNISLPSGDDFRPSRTSSLAERRKKKPGTDTTAAGGTKDSKGSVNRLPSISVGRTTSSGGYPSRRKGGAVLDDEADVDDDDAGEGSDDLERPGSGVGTLRGAMQGKAEHVVYGPKRIDDGTGFVASPTPGGMGKVVPIKAISTVGNATTARSDAVARGEIRSGSSNANHTVKDNLGETAAANNEKERRRLKSPMDPDDTMHPDYRDSPRLTPEVLMSSESMPVLSSPKGEEPPTESPFTPEEDQAQDQQRQGSSAPPTTESSTSNLPHSSSSTRNVIASTTSFSHAASSIFAPTSPFSPTSPQSVPAHLPSESDLLPPHSSSPNPPSHAPIETVLAPPVPAEVLPLAPESIPSGTSVIASPTNSKVSTPTGQVPSPAVLLPPTLFNAPVAAIPIPLLSVPSPTIAQNLIAAAVDLGAGEKGVPTLIKWKNEDGQEERKGGVKKGPKEVYVTGTFANGWKVKIELRKTDATDFSALISLPPGPHRLKFIVDNEWKASKHLPVATDADGNLINYLQVNPVDTKPLANLWASATGTATSGTSTPSNPTSPDSSNQQTKTTSSPTASSGSTVGGTPTAVPINVLPSHQQVNPSSRLREQAVARSAGQSVSTSYNSQWPGILAELGGAPSLEDEGGDNGGNGQGVYDEDDFATWTQEIPPELEQWGEWELERDQIESDWLNANPNPTNSTPGPVYPPQPPSAGVPPPTLPAQLEKGPLNHAAYVTMGSGDDNSILPKPDHSVINHLAASPIKGGFLSVGVTTRYKRKFVTIVYYKALAR